MSRQDYLLRLIETVGLMLMRLRAMLLGGEIDPTTARDEIQNAAGRAGLDLPFLSSVDGDTLVMLMSPAGEVEPGRCWITAELFLVEGLRLRAEEDEPGARDALARALLLYRLIDPDAVVARGFPEVRTRIAEVEAMMDAGV